MSSGYTWCRCRDCPEQVVSNDESDPDFCSDCEEAGCEDDCECQREDAYEAEDDTDELESDPEPSRD